MNRFRASATLLGVCLLAAAPAGATTLKLISSGAAEILGGYQPHVLLLSSTPPDGLKKPPAELTKPEFGVITMGPAGAKTRFIVIADHPADGPPRLIVDSNGNGDLTDDPPAEWKEAPHPNTPVSVIAGGASVNVPGAPGPYHLGMYRFIVDPNDTTNPRSRLRNAILYYADYAYQGTARIGSKSYPVMLLDMGATGDFRGSEDPQESGASLAVDRNGDGRFAERGKVFDVRRPFNIDGVSYKITNLTPNGGTFDIVPSTEKVGEIPMAPDLTVGSKALPFQATSMAGKPIKMPQSYSGRIVLIDFWATWCGPCVGEIPGVVAAYRRFHALGFDVLGISLDQPDQAAKLTAFTQQHHMPWPEIYDGKYWDSRIAQQYGIDSIPHPFLVDGDTGKILAEGETLRGDTLAPAIRKALVHKGKIKG